MKKPKHRQKLFRFYLVTFRNHNVQQYKPTAYPEKPLSKKNKFLRPIKRA